MSCTADVPTVLNGRVDTDESGTSPFYVEYVCESGFSMSGNKRIFCTDNEWDEPPTCSEIEPVPEWVFIVLAVILFLLLLLCLICLICYFCCGRGHSAGYHDDGGGSNCCSCCRRSKKNDVSHHDGNSDNTTRDSYGRRDSVYFIPVRKSQVYTGNTHYLPAGDQGERVNKSVAVRGTQTANDGYKQTYKEKPDKGKEEQPMVYDGKKWTYRENAQNPQTEKPKQSEDRGVTNSGNKDWNKGSRDSKAWNDSYSEKKPADNDSPKKASSYTVTRAEPYTQSKPVVVSSGTKAAPVQNPPTEKAKPKDDEAVVTSGNKFVKETHNPKPLNDSFDEEKPVYTDTSNKASSDNAVRTQPTVQNKPTYGGGVDDSVKTFTAVQKPPVEKARQDDDEGVAPASNKFVREARNPKPLDEKKPARKDTYSKAPSDNVTREPRTTENKPAYGGGVTDPYEDWYRRSRDKGSRDKSWKDSYSEEKPLDDDDDFKPSTNGVSRSPRPARKPAYNPSPDRGSRGSKIWKDNYNETQTSYNGDVYRGHKHVHNSLQQKPAKEVKRWLPHSRPVRYDHNTSTK